MSSTAPTCLRCQHAMEAGLIIDRGDYNIATVPEWLEGAPEKTFWSGLKTGDRHKFAVRTFRCTHCGYLESYANP